MDVARNAGEGECQRERLAEGAHGRAEGQEPPVGQDNFELGLDTARIPRLQHAPEPKGSKDPDHDGGFHGIGMQGRWKAGRKPRRVVGQHEHKAHQNRRGCNPDAIVSVWHECPLPCGR